MKIGRMKISRRKLVDTKIGRNENWSIRKLIDTKIGRYENWSLRKLVVAKISREQRVVEINTIFENHNINNFRVRARVHPHPPSASVSPSSSHPPVTYPETFLGGGIKSIFLYVVRY